MSVGRRHLRTDVYELTAFVSEFTSVFLKCRARRSSIYPGLELDLPEMSSNKVRASPDGQRQGFCLCLDRPFQKLPLSLRRLSTVPEKPKVRRTRAAQAKTNLEENNASKFVRGAGQENGHTETGASASTFHALGEETTESEVTGKTMDIREEKKLSGSSRKPPRVIHNARKNNTVKTKSPKRDLCNSVPTCPLAKEVRVMLNRREAKHVRQTTSVVDSSDKQSLRAASPLSLIESPLKSCSPKSQSSRSPLRNVENSLVFDQTGTPLKVPLAGAQEDVLQSNLWTGDLHKACVIM